MIDDEPGRRSVLPDVLAGAWRGVAAWTEETGGWQPWRVRPELLAQVMSDVLSDRARIPNGIRLEAVTDATGLELRMAGDPERGSTAEVLVDGELVAQLPVDESPAEHWVDLPGRQHRLEIWLPHSGRTTLQVADLVGASVVAPAVPLDFRWCAYGSSITQCNAALSPTTTWPALVAREQGWDLTALGMAGQCHLDLPMASACAESMPDLVTLCLGINVYGSGTFNARSLPPAVTGFLTTLRGLLGPEIPVVVISPIASPSREQERNPAGVTLAEVREIVTAGVTLLQRDDDRLSLVDGLEVINLDEGHLLGDGLHPNPEGYVTMAQRLGPVLAAASRLEHSR